MRYDLEPGVFAHVEALACRLNRVTSICVAGDVLVDRLDSDLKTRAAVAEHGAIVEVTEG